MYPGAMGRTTAYDRVATMFSPKGRLYQVEYASKIVEQGTLGVGMVFKNGVLFGADKNIVSSLVIPESVEKLFKVDDHIGAISAGLVGDARRLIRNAREKAQENQMYYGDKIEVETLVKEISALKQVFTQYAGMRPFGVSFVIGGVSKGEKKVFETEPSGALARYKATAIGKGKPKAMTVLEKEHKENISLKKGVKLIVKVIKSSKQKKKDFSIKNLDFATIEEKKGFERIPSSKLKSLLGKK